MIAERLCEPKKRKSAFGLAVHQKICTDTTPNQHGRDGLEVDRAAVENVRAATKERVASQKCKAVNCAHGAGQAGEE